MRFYDSDPFPTYTPTPAPVSASASASAPSSAGLADQGGGQYFSDPYVNSDSSVGGKSAPVQAPLTTGLQLLPGQSYKPGALNQSVLARDTGATFLGSRGGYAPGYQTVNRGGGYPGRYNSQVSYVGPTVSARPRFNVDLRRYRLRDLFSVK